MPEQREGPGRLPSPDAIAHVCTGRPSETDGRGYRAWQTRRANRFLKAVADLRWPRRPHDQMLDWAREVSRFLPIVLHPGALPRGYGLVRRTPGEPLEYRLVRGDAIYDPEWHENPPSPEALECLANDLKTGWVLELAAIAPPGEGSALLARLGDLLK